MYEVRDVALRKIRPSRWQARGKVFDEERLWELARSIQEQGLINAPVGFEYVLGQVEWRSWLKWPEGWPRPWEDKDV